MLRRALALKSAAAQTRSTSEQTRVVGRFEIIRRIGRGGMATVYLARQAGLGRQVALKQLASFDEEQDASLVERFLHEARLAGSLNHPNIVTVYDFFEDDGAPYIAMEYLERGSLRPHVGKLTLAQVVGALECVLAGLAHAAEAGIVHRDLKPENLLVTREGMVKIADLGIAKAYNQVSLGLTATGLAIGTPSYMAPEQAMAQAVSPATDLYATGVIAFELLAGRVPFVGATTPLAVLLQHVNEPPPPLRSLREDIPPGLAAWVERMLAKEPEERPASAAEAWQTLEELAVEQLGWRWRQQARLTEIQASHEAKTPVAGSDAPTEPAQPEPEERAASQSRVSTPELATTLPPITVTPPAHPGEPPGPVASDPTLEETHEEDAAPLDAPETQPVPTRAAEPPRPRELVRTSSPAPQADVDPAPIVQPREAQGRPQQVLPRSWLGQHVMFVTATAALLATALIAVALVTTRGSPGRNASRQTNPAASEQARKAAVAAAVAANPVEAQRVQRLAAWIVKGQKTTAVEEAALARGLPRSQAQENTTLHRWEAAAEGREQLIGQIAKAMNAERTITAWDSSFLQVQIDKLTATEKNINTITSTMRGHESGPLVDPREVPDAERFLAQFNPLSERYLGRTFSKADL